MADTKISALPASTTPLAGTETLPIVQGGVTKKVSVADLTAGRSVASAGGTFSDNLVQGTAGKGVNFTANTPAAGMTSQLLNWYEEGTWTPVLNFGGASVGVTGSLTGTWTRTGRVVTLTGLLILSNKGSSTGAASITGFPYSVGTGGVGAIYYDAMFGLTLTSQIISGFLTSMNLLQMSTTGYASITDVNFTNGSVVSFSVVYTV
jgi:hypothetical protein